ncbi:MAG: leucyl aminopeptidase [Bacteroidetes bacterium]|nr:leucyl aminopeptidase [Bacteroidota bacterium]MDA1119534.1 leucyl aminopeptidase [Bacteroidota bacterium]
MRIEVTSDQNALTNTIIIPLVKNDELSNNLKYISQSLGLNPDMVHRDFTGEKHEVFNSHFNNGSAGRVIILGLGSDNIAKNCFRAVELFILNNREKIEKSISFNLSYLHPNDLIRLLEESVKGVILGSYNLGLYKTKREQHVFDLTICANGDNLEEIARNSQVVAETQVRVRDLVNASSSNLTPARLGVWAAASGKEFGFDVTVLSKDQIIKENLNALLAVNQGSALPPSFIISEYKGKGAQVTVGLVGKGVTFDTGGISIKGSKDMHDMKSDMAGAAAVLGIIEVAAKLELAVHIVAVVPSTENAVDANSVKPGDIIHSHSGKTIEVIDTDAEGRLILADALSYITTKYKPDVLIDFATLTGSIIGTLGYHAAGLFANNKLLETQLIDSSLSSGEKVWPMPLWSDYEEDLESDVADIKNYSGKPLAGAITAAKFLEVFINGHLNWAHIDIAGTAFKESPMCKHKNATAYGVELILDFIESNLSRDRR